MEIKKSEYKVSSAKISQCPKDNLMEFAFIGRSNVGKSSLINMLCNHKNLAKTSATPGKTLLINHFLIESKPDNQWYIIDLPGYGFAKRSKKVQDEIENMMYSFRMRTITIGQGRQNVFLFIGKSLDQLPHRLRGIEVLRNNLNGGDCNVKCVLQLGNQ